MSNIILVIEDDKSLTNVIDKKLRLSGFETLLTTSVDGALEMMSKKQPIDYIWLDHYLLGDKNGLDFVKAVKKNESWKNVPIYVVSNTASDDKVKTYFDMGITKFFEKSNHRLDEIINDILSHPTDIVKA